MSVSEDSKVILLLGAIALLVSQALSTPIFDEVVLGYVGLIYILTATSYEVRESVSFRYAVAVSVASVSLPVLHRLVSVSAARAELAPAEFTFVFFQEFVLIPLAAAFMAPLGRATDHTARLTILGITVVPFVVAVLRIGTRGFGFFFNLGMFSLMFATGIVLGLPLFLLGKADDPESTSSVLKLPHRS